MKIFRASPWIEFAVKACLWLHISYRTHPKAQMSLNYINFTIYRNIFCFWTVQETCTKEFRCWSVQESHFSDQELWKYQNLRVWLCYYWERCLKFSSPYARSFSHACNILLRLLVQPSLWSVFPQFSFLLSFQWADRYLLLTIGQKVP